MQIAVGTMMLIGCTFLLLASIGIIRMPDLFMRMSASAKAGTLGIGCMLIALMLHFRDGAVVTKSILVISFFFLMSPVAAHMIARAGYIVRVPLWKHSVVDEAKHLHAPKAIVPTWAENGDEGGGEPPQSDDEMRV
ncbi:MAG: monovalent cation/H(+) antiporter subunit G [Acidobacteria bacterium]|nr:monovalent cation/H(+) antiporter subunit G [Acidobacteriota bacterium]